MLGGRRVVEHDAKFISHKQTEKKEWKKKRIVRKKYINISQNALKKEIYMTW